VLGRQFSPRPHALARPSVHDAHGERGHRASGTGSDVVHGGSPVDEV
jgi:hypothetical protein